MSMIGGIVAIVSTLLTTVGEPVEPFHRRERRLRAWLAALALERLEQRCLLAADVRAGPSVQDDRDAAEDVVARLQLLERTDEHFVGAGVLAADVHEHVRRLDCVRGDQAALDEPVRDGRHDLVVLEAARLGLVRVDDEVVRVRVLVRLRDERPLAAGREERAAPAAQLRGEDLVDQRLRRHPARLCECAVAADRLVLGELRQVALVGAGEDDAQSPSRSSCTICGTSSGFTCVR
jgi:hypothetical protein